MITKRSKWVAALGAVWCCASALAQAQPGVSTPPAATPTITAGGVRLPSGLFDEKSDAVKDISRARDRARRTGRNVLLMWGENNSEFCVRLHTLLHDDTRIRGVIESEYEVVPVDVGHFERNVDLAHDIYGADLLRAGVPDLTIINPANNQPLALMTGKDAMAKPVTPAHTFDERFVLEFLERNKPAPRPASGLLMESQQRATRGGKRLLAYFTGPGCRACAMWDRFLDDPESGPALDRAFVVQRIDLDRNPGGAAALRKLNAREGAGTPWMVALDGEGKPDDGAAAGYSLQEGAGADPLLDWLVSASAGKLTADDRSTLAAAALRAFVDPKSPIPSPSQPSAGTPDGNTPAK